MKKYFYTLVCCLIVVSALPSPAAAQTAVKSAPRKYDKLLTAVESFAKLNVQIAIREREFTILAPFVEDVKDYSNQLSAVCDMKCSKSVGNYYPKLTKFSGALYEANRRYQALTPDITDKNAALMSEMKRVEFLPDQLSKAKAIAALNQLNLENIYHYKAYANTYHSADTAMPSLSPTSDLAAIISSYATTTDRLVKAGRAKPQMSTDIGNIKSKVPDIYARIKELEDKRKSIVCTATLSSTYSVEVHCLP